MPVLVQAGANLDHVECVAAVFSLSSWQLLLPNCPQDQAGNGRLQSLLNHYMSASTDGRANIARVAELEALYATEGQSQLAGKDSGGVSGG